MGVWLLFSTFGILPHKLDALLGVWLYCDLTDVCSLVMRYTAAVSEASISHSLLKWGTRLFRTRPKPGWRRTGWSWLILWA